MVLWNYKGQQPIELVGFRTSHAIVVRATSFSVSVKMNIRVPILKYVICNIEDTWLLLQSRATRFFFGRVPNLYCAFLVFPFCPST